MVANFLLAFVFASFAWYDPTLMLKTFVISLPTFAYLLTLLYFEIFKQQYYFYRNFGYTRLQLMAFGLLMNTTVSTIIYLFIKTLFLT